MKRFPSAVIAVLVAALALTGPSSYGQPAPTGGAVGTGAPTVAAGVGGAGLGVLPLVGIVAGGLVVTGTILNAASPSGAGPAAIGGEDDPGPDPDDGAGGTPATSTN